MVQHSCRATDFRSSLPGPRSHRGPRRRPGESRIGFVGAWGTRRIRSLQPCNRARGGVSRRGVEAIDAWPRPQERRRIQTCRELLGTLRRKRTDPEDIPFGPSGPLQPAGIQMGLASVPPRDRAGQRSRLACARAARARLSFSARPVSVRRSPSSAGANDASLGIQSRGG